MKRMFLLPLVLSVSVAQAQGYFGFGAALSASPKYGLVPMLSVQIGGPTAPEFGSLELRAAFDTLLLFSNLGLDALTSFHYDESGLRVYLGGGPDVLVFASLDALPERGIPVFFGAHGTLGVEFVGLESVGRVRPFAEVQPAAALISGEPVFGIRVRAGVNF